ncbi:hypothetical protein [Clostridium sp. CM027]|nr:hypothetical protein [Clostridium sp. CM027]
MARDKCDIDNISVATNTNKAYKIELSGVSHDTINKIKVINTAK